MENYYTELSMVANSALVVKVEYHPPLVFFKKHITDAEKPILVGNIPPLRFVGGPINQVSTGKTYGSWEQEILVVFVKEVGVLVK